MKEIILNLLNSVNREGMDKVVEFLEQSDFFTAPASTKYHGNFQGGLAEHSYNVYTLFKEKNEKYKLELPEETVVIAALLHDLCKTNFYKKGIRNVKQGKKLNWKGQEVDNWIEKEVWEVEDSYPIGHGEKSIIILQGFIKLTIEEIMLIRWHMGGFESKDSSLTMYNAYNLMPACVALHTADIEASYFLEKKVEV
ncbi:HD domain-containing protein [Clostridium sp. HMP27]|uniref:HD domain-containing protein n=1 Tax=Clostridium sp. HMP27 TaxID=1487921 RepID=UPI00052DF4BA|nr:HD domain-containing protein [Clostridium sp. HMP27]KGK88008.1 metal-dependent phosphohydrolase [Clostridium sp. HMP27]